MPAIEAQTRIILRMLRERPEGITAIDALREAHSLRLAARISDLRDEGHQITTEMYRLADGKRIARYRLVAA